MSAFHLPNTPMGFDWDAFGGDTQSGCVLAKFLTGEVGTSVVDD
jgi:hypothetical protein